MEKRYDELMWNMIKKEEPLQKLTYKAAWGGAGDSFYAYLLSKLES